jgi:thiamine biosynthesis lipoprotein
MYKLLTAVCGLPFFLLFSGCEMPTPSTSDTITGQQLLQGKTMGTTYSVKYTDDQGRNLQPQLDSLLELLNLEVSTYIPESTISQFNQSKDSMDISGKIFFMDNLKYTDRLYRTTEGYFDPTVMPLVNYFGFGYLEKNQVSQLDSMTVDSLFQFVGWEKIEWDEIQIRKTTPGVELDFSALAKGYGVDLLGTYLERQGIDDYLVEIGGELRARGLNDKGEVWTVGVNTPSPQASVSDYKAILKLADKGMATSGNYRNFYEVDGQKYAHTFNPKTGYPEISSLLSATVIAVDCTTADAVATACMAMGLEKAYEMIKEMDGIEALFIYSDENGKMAVRQSPGMNDMVTYTME